MKNSRALLRLGIIASIAATGPTLEAQTQAVKIRVIDVSNDRPLAKQTVSITLLYSKDEKAPATYDANSHLETGVNGEAQFRFPEPAPAHFAAQVRLTSEYWHCACLALGVTQDLIEKGIVQKPDRRSEPSPAERKQDPALILFLARPFTFFERQLYPLVKQ